MSFTQRSKDTKYYTSYYDEGLRNYLLGVYNYMTGALGVTGLIAYFISSSPELLRLIYDSPVQWLVMFAPIVFVVVFSIKLNSMRVETAQIAFWVFSGIMGVSLSWIFVVYTGTSIAKVFFISAAMFGSMALYGNSTKRDLTSFGSFFIMGVFGLLIASLINIVMQSSALEFAISLVGVILFAGLTAYDAQKIKDVYYKYNHGCSSEVSKLAIMGALQLYLDFINIFINLLRLIGDRK